MSVQKAIVNLDAEIIVIDNNSSDDSCEMMKRVFPNVKLIQNKENFGFPKGNNIGVKEAKGEYLCVLNPDTVVGEDTFEKILTFAKSKNDLGIVGCKLIDGKGNFLPESKRGIPTPWVSFTKIFGLYKLFPNATFFNKYYAQHLKTNQTGKVEILVGAFMILERELYNEIGGFDENCFMYSDDIDLSYMVLQKGKQNYYFHDTTVIHYKGESTIKDETYMKRFQEAMNFFYRKHFNPEGSGSIFFSFFMKIGIVFFSIVKMFQGKKKATTSPENYILVSEKSNKNEILTKLKNTLKADFVNKNRAEVATEFIIDSSSFTFKEIIKLLESNKNKDNTFKILMNDSNYLIGSNSSNNKGEIILIND